MRGSFVGFSSGFGVLEWSGFDGEREVWWFWVVSEFE
jgi:hypothetical protein